MKPTINKRMARLLARSIARRLSAPIAWEALRDAIALQCDALDCFQLDMLTDWTAAELERRAANAENQLKHFRG